MRSWGSERQDGRDEAERESRPRSEPAQPIGCEGRYDVIGLAFTVVIPGWIPASVRDSFSAVNNAIGAWLTRTPSLEKALQGGRDFLIALSPFTTLSSHGFLELHVLPGDYGVRNAAGECQRPGKCISSVIKQIYVFPRMQLLVDTVKPAEQIRASRAAPHL
ncbi:hypothetical protein MHYP_G00262860 [Metynnis hypsauchen]